MTITIDSKHPDRDARIIAFIAKGNTQAEAAIALNIPFSVICGVVRRYRQVTGKWDFARTRRSPASSKSPSAQEKAPAVDNAERDAEIVRLLNEGMLQRQVAERFGMTQSGIARVLQRLRGYKDPERRGIRTICPTPEPAALSRLAALFAEADRLLAEP